MDEAYDSPPVFQTGALPSHLALPSPTLGLCVLGPRLPVFGVTVRVFSRLPTSGYTLSDLEPLPFASAAAGPVAVYLTVS